MQCSMSTQIITAAGSHCKEMTSSQTLCRQAACAPNSQRGLRRPATAAGSGGVAIGSTNSYMDAVCFGGLHDALRHIEPRTRLQRGSLRCDLAVGDRLLGCCGRRRARRAGRACRAGAGRLPLLEGERAAGFMHCAHGAAGDLVCVRPLWIPCQGLRRRACNAQPLSWHHSHIQHVCTRTLHRAHGRPQLRHNVPLHAPYSSRILPCAAAQQKTGRRLCMSLQKGTG